MRISDWSSDVCSSDLIGDKVVVPFTISCGKCYFCERGLYSACDTTNPKPEVAIKLMGHATCGMYGYSHMTGGFPGGQAEYVRVPQIGRASCRERVCQYV